MSAFDSLTAILRDPPPEFAFEISAVGIAMSRTKPPATVQFQPLEPGTLSPSPVRENVLDADAFADAVRKLAPTPSNRRRRTAALILPDQAVRIAILDFETLPEKEDERQSLIRFRMRKTLPFDIDEAAVSYHVQAGNKVIVAVAPVEIIARYEAPFRAANLHPGFVTCSSMALLELLPNAGSVLAAHQGAGSLSLLGLRDGVLTLARTLEMDRTASLADDLYPTLVYLEDQTGQRPERLILIGPTSGPSAEELSAELKLPVELVPDEHAALTGYLRSVDPIVRRAAA
jgi:type IV pilus assembly protein PilM